MPIELAGHVYYYTEELVLLLDVSRQSLWRWRRAEKIPRGQKIGGKAVLYSQDELEAIRRYVNRFESQRGSDHFSAKRKRSR